MNLENHQLLKYAQALKIFTLSPVKHYIQDRAKTGLQLFTWKLTNNSTRVNSVLHSHSCQPPLAHPAFALLVSVFFFSGGPVDQNVGPRLELNVPDVFLFLFSLTFMQRELLYLLNLSLNFIFCSQILFS